MCGRFIVFTSDDYKEMQRIAEEIQKIYGEDSFKSGEICPTDPAAILLDENNLVVPKLSRWGFPNQKNKGILINARAETLLERLTFMGGFENGRCIVPCTGFFEWDKQTKQKYLFSLPNEPMLYMTALRDTFGGEERFVILTTEANDSMRPIHNRMPLILTENNMEDWLYDSRSARYILKEVPPNVQNK